MKKFVNGSKFTVGQKAKIVNCNQSENEDNAEDSTLIGVKGFITNPFASGCKDAGWVGFCAANNTLYGYNFNVHESEIEAIED